MERLYTRKEAAKALGISLTTLDQAKKCGVIAYIQYVDNGCIYFTEAALQEYIARCTHREKPIEHTTTYRKPRGTGT